MKKKEHFYIVGGSVNQFNHYGRQCGDNSRIQKQKFHLTQQSHYWVYTQRIINCSVIKTHAHICSLWRCLKQLRPGTNPNAHNDRLEKKKKNVAHIHHGILCSHKKDEFVFFVETWMNLETIILSKLTQEQKTKHHMFHSQAGDEQ